MKREIVG